MFSWVYWRQQERLNNVSCEREPGCTLAPNPLTTCHLAALHLAPSVQTCSVSFLHLINHCVCVHKECDWGKKKCTCLCGVMSKRDELLSLLTSVETWIWQSVHAKVTRSRGIVYWGTVDGITSCGWWMIDGKQRNVILACIHVKISNWLHPFVQQHIMYDATLISTICDQSSTFVKFPIL